MEVKVISTEMIKPSSPTPPHLRFFKLSVIDQLFKLLYVTTIFHYPLNDSNRNIKQLIHHLKSSLSKTLTRFYPLAGRIHDAYSMVCNDEGVLFIEARVNADMNDFLKRPDLESMHDLVPSLVVDEERKSACVQVGIQLNVFASGGFSIGLCTLHKLMDGVTISAFMKCWAAVCGGGCEKSLYPDLFLGSSLFPPQKIPPDMTFLRGIWLHKQGKGVQRRFVFDSRAITALKAVAASELVPNPSRVQVVASFIWKCMMAASQRVNGSKQLFVLATALNMRSRMKPPIFENSIGNILYWVMVRHSLTHGNGLGLKNVVGLVNHTLAKFNSDYIRSLQGDEGFLLMRKYVEEIHEFHSKERPDTVVFSSVNRLGFNDIDFGWGKSVWVTHPRRTISSNKFVSTITLGESGHGDAIEAWLVLGENEMAVLENDLEFLTFASSNPGVIVPKGRL